MENNNTVYSKMFLWLFIGLLISFVTGFVISNDVGMTEMVVTVGLIPIVIIQLGVALVLSLLLNKLHPVVMKVLYLVYSFVTGLTFSTVFLMYELDSIISIFLMTSVIFGVMALYGFITKRDLTKVGRFLFVALLGMIIASLLNVFIFKSPMGDMILNWIGVGVFTLFIAYDVHKVKHLVSALDVEKASIYGAFQLYLDFINLFIRLLRLLGKARD